MLNILFRVLERKLVVWPPWQMRIWETGITLTIKDGKIRTLESFNGGDMILLRPHATNITPTSSLILVRRPSASPTLNNGPRSHTHLRQPLSLRKAPPLPSPFRPVIVDIFLEWIEGFKSGMVPTHKAERMECSRVGIVSHNIPPRD